MPLPGFEGDHGFEAALIKELFGSVRASLDAGGTVVAGIQISPGSARR